MATVTNRPRSSSASSRPTSRTNYRNGPVTKPSAGSGRNSNIASDGKRQIVGQYMLGKTIGEGTFGKVKLAVHMPSGEKVAVKILEKSRIKESADVRRVNREIKILKKARHGNIIQLYEVLDTPNAIYLIMECAEGGEMFDFIVAQKHVPEPQACKFFHQIVDGVESLHLNEITHRDLKPENLLLKASPDGWIVKVVDFGLSNTHEGGRLLSTACGSPCYAAPEMIAGKKYVGPMADIWSMGVILFALVCGYLPFEDANTAILYKKILSGDYRPPKWISAEVKDLIRCILEVDPKKRYTMADIRAHPWYKMISEANIPREVSNEREDEITRAETLKVLAGGGLDMQQLLDGLGSHACNSLTATYYLFEQKHRAARLKQAQSHPHPTTNHHQSDNHLPADRTAINGNNNNNDNQTHRPKSNPNPLPDTTNQTVKPSPLFTNPVVAAPAPTTTHHAPLILPSTTAAGTVLSPKSPVTAVNVKTTNENANPTANNRLSTNPVGPYLQTPQILQQARLQAQVNQPASPTSNANANMPSLDYYMKTGLTLPIGVTPNANQINNAALHSGNNPVNNNVKLVISKPNGIVPPINITGTNNTSNLSEIPKLTPKNARNVAVPPLQRLSNATNQANEPLLSQTARLPVANPIITETVNTGALSARAALETTQHVVIPSEFSPSNNSGDPYDMEGKGRPSTRRSRMRSRNGGDAPLEEPMYEPLPAEGLLEMDEVPIKNDSNVLNANTAAERNDNEENEGTRNQQMIGVAEKENRDSSVNSNNGASIRAPDAPKASSALGGRRGKNIVTATNPNVNNNPTPNNPSLQPVAPTVSRPSAPTNPNTNAVPPLKPVRPAPPNILPAGVAPDGTAFTNNRNEANRNKLAAQGTFRPF